MPPKNFPVLTATNLLKKLICWTGIAGISTAIALPISAQFYPPYGLYHPGLHRIVTE